MLEDNSAGSQPLLEAAVPRLWALRPRRHCQRPPCSCCSPLRRILELGKLFLELEMSDLSRKGYRQLILRFGNNYVYIDRVRLNFHL